MSKVRVVLKPGGFVIASIFAMIIAVVGVFIVATQPERFHMSPLGNPATSDASPKTAPAAPLPVPSAPAPLPASAKPITNWLVLRPLPIGIPRSEETDLALRKNDLAQMLAKTLLPNEGALAPKASDKTSFQKQTFTWAATNAATIDLVEAKQTKTPAMGPANVAAYAVTYVDAPQATANATLYLGSDDGVAVWLNGKEIWRNPVSRGCILGEDTVTNLALRKGRNIFVFKVVNWDGAWQLSAALDTP